MKRFTLAIMVFLFSALAAKAQTGFTQVHSVVLDPSGTPYANCSGNAAFVPSPSATTFPTIGGSTFPTTAVIASCDSFGAFNLTLADNNFVVDGHTSPPASQWQFNILAREGHPGFACTMTITGLAQDISTQIQACAAPLPATGGGNVFAFSVVQQSATPSFVGNQDTVFAFLLNQSVTSSTFITNAKPGTSPIYYVNPCQDNVGGRTMVWPSNVTLPANYVFSTAPNACSPVAFAYNPNTATWSPWMNLNAGGGGGGTPVSLQTNGAVNASQTVLNIKNGTGINATSDGSGGVTINNTGSGISSGGAGVGQASNGSSGFQQMATLEANGVYQVNESLEVKGLNPHVDATRYGVRALASLNATPAASGLTSTTTGGLATVTVSTSSCPSQISSVCFVNGDGVVLPNAGAAQSMTTPSAPTVTPFNSRWGTNTGDGVAAPAASSTYNYKLFAFDLLRGRTAASSVGTTTTSPATLGEVTYSITGGTKSNDTITFTGGSQPAVSVGALAIVDTPTQSNDNCYLGYWKVSTVTGTGFTLAQVGMDTRNPMPSNCLATSNGGFTAHFFNYNRVIAPAVTGAYGYGFCSDRATPGTYHLLGTALYATDLINALNTYGTLEFDDFGATMTDANHVAPWEFSDSDCNAVAPTNDDWQTTILSGAGTTTLTMSANAPNSNGGGQPIRFDNSPTYLNARTAVGNSIAIMLPLTTGQYVFNSPLDLRAFQEIMSAPQGFTTNAVVYFNGGALYCNSPTPGSGSSAPVQNKSVPVINTLGLPGVQIGNFSFYGNSCRFSAPNNGTAVQYDGIGADLGSTFVDSQFASGSTSNDYLGRGFVCHNTPATNLNCDVSFTGKTSISGGVQSMASHSATPSVICDGCGMFYFTDLTGFGRTLGIRGRANNAALAVKNMWWQGPSMPMFLLGGQQNAGNNNATVILGSTAPVITDTSNWPCASYIPSVGTSSITFITYGGCVDVGTAGLQFTGVRFSGPGITSLNGAITGQNRDAQQNMSGNANDNIFSGPTAGLSTYPEQKFDSALLTDPTYPIFVNGVLPAQPTCSVAAGGGVSVGNHKYQIVPVWWNGGEGNASNPSSTCTTSGGNQQVTVNWTAVPGTPQGYNIYEDGLRIHNASGVGVSCSTPQITPGSTNSIVLTQDGNCGIPGPSSVPSGGPTMMQPGVQGMSAPVDLITQYIDILATTLPANPSVTAGRLSFNSITGQLTCQTTTGASCIPSGIGTGTQNCLTDWATTSSLGTVCSQIAGQVAVANNGSAPTFLSPSMIDSPNSPVSTTPYVIACDNASTIIDRTKTIRFQSGASAITIPLSSASGCLGLVTTVFDDGAGTLTFTRSSPDTLTIVNGSTALDAQTSFTLANGQYATISQNATGLWLVRVAIGASAGVSSFTGDGALLCNSSSTGAVTASICGSTSAHKYWGNPSGVAGAAGFNSLVVGDLPTGIPNANLANPSTTVNTQTCTLGSSCTVTYANIPVGAIANGTTATTQSAGDNTTDVATDQFVTTAVSNAIGAVNPAVAVLAATTGSNLTGTYSNGVSGVGATFTITATGAFTLDGVAINTIGQRVLLKDQTSAFQNGVYTATVVGALAVSPVFTRALDYDQPSDINTTGAIPVQSGTVNASTSWLLTSTVNTVGTDSLTYVQFTIAPTTIATKIANGTAVMGTSAISSGACATVVTVSATGVATTDVITVGFNGDPTAVTGYGASATGAVLTIYPYPSTNNVNFKVCNSSSGSITPGALTLNWKVVR